jgi:hypothetical protein
MCVGDIFLNLFICGFIDLIMKSKLGIVSFILASLTFLFSIFLLININTWNFPSFFSLILYFFAPIISLVLSILSLNEIKKKGLEGKVYAIMGMILSVLIMVGVPILYFLLADFSGVTLI